MEIRKITQNQKRWGGALLALFLVVGLIGCSRSGGTTVVRSNDKTLSTGWENEIGGNLLWSVDDLRDAMNDPGNKVVVIDCRIKEADFNAGHIIGAKWINWKELSNDIHTELPITADVEQFLGRDRGIARTDTICLYSGGTMDAFRDPFRLFWLLEYFGCQDVHILNGGINRWINRGYVVSTANWSSVSITPRTFTAQINPDVYADLAEMTWAVDNANSGILSIIDSRTGGEYSGEVATLIQDRAGRIPSAAHVYWAETINLDTGRINHPKTVKTLLANAGVTPGVQVYTTATAGVRSTVLYFICRLLGYPVKVYLGGTQEWADVDGGSPLSMERSGSFIHKSMAGTPDFTSFGSATAVYGDKIFLFGGLNSNVETGEIGLNGGAWSFDPSVHPLHEGSDTDNWRVLAQPTNLDRWGLMAASDPDGDAIYLFGGSDNNGTVFDTIYRCDVDPATFKITNVAELSVSLPEGLYGSGCVRNETDGLIYIFGGIAADGTLSDKVYAFTPESLGGPALNEKSSLPSARSWAGSAALGGKIYSVGGEAAGDTILDELLEYDPVLDNWAVLPNMADARFGVTGAVVHGRIYVCGGFTHDGASGYVTTGSSESFDPANPGDGWRSEETMSVAKYWHGMEAVDNVIYLFSGYNGNPRELSNANQNPNVVAYRPVRESTRSPMPGMAQYSGSSAAIGDNIYIFGGYESGVYSDRVLEYDAAADSWSDIDSLPQGALMGSSAVAVGQSIVVLGGSGDSGLSAQAWLLDPTAASGSQWSRLADMPAGRYGASAVYHDDSTLFRFVPYGPDLVLVIGGFDDNDFGYDSILLYDVNNNSWHDSGIATLPNPKAWAAATKVDNKIFSIGGVMGDGFVLNECLMVDLEAVSLDWLNAGQMPTPRYGFGAALIGDEIYTVGGIAVDRDDDSTLSLDSVEVLHVTEGHWTVNPGLSETRSLSFVLPSTDDSFFVIGGMSYSAAWNVEPSYHNDVIEYNP